MAYDSLQDFVTRLEKSGELLRIREPLDPFLEICEVTDRVCKAGGPALLFEAVKGQSIPVLTNAFGSLKRMCLALEVDSLDRIGEEIRQLLEFKPPQGLMGKLRLLPKLKRLRDVLPRRVDQGPCQEVVFQENPNLYSYPILTTWPQDGGPFITLPLVITRDPETGRRNVGLYRLQVFDGRTLGVHWQIHKVGARHFQTAERLGQDLPVAVVLGPDPALTYAATAPLPDELDEFMLAGFLRREPVKLVRCRTVDLEVPANAQIVIEGVVKAGERRREGPFGDHTGYYSPADDYPVLHVTCITQRKTPIYPATVVGVPPMEDAYLGKATERIFLPLLHQTLPEIRDLHLPVAGAFHNFVFVAIDKRYPGHAKKVMTALWGLGQMMFSKFIVVFDAAVDVQDLNQVIWQWGANVDPRRDLLLVDGPVDALDHAAPLPCLGSKIGFDATTKWPEEGLSRLWPEVIRMDPEVVKRIDQLWGNLGLGR
ncbi:MAG: menaquinone biosynthesis decarboxylase [Deltaproteobacteria bacterium]|nr:menaquinone biosynthesis decarboxylase [Deltaproteobacteria bacterium]